MRTALRLVSLAIVLRAAPAVVAQGTQSATDPVLPAGVQRWVATDGVATPWLFDLVIHDGIVTGAPIPGGAPRTPAVIAPSTSRADSVVRYKGFTIDITAIAASPDRDQVLARVRLQLDLVDSLHISADLHRFFQSVPLVMVSSGGSAAYGRGRVMVPDHSSAPYDRQHPVLLHELCHAYHDLRVPDGMKNAKILALYQQARDGGKFPAGSYMLSKPGEYFAMMASVYLYGSAARDPFTRDAIRLRQPEMGEWLNKEFGAMP